MSSHLSEEQISAWVSGERNDEAARHLGECVLCRSEVDNTAGVLLLFRDSGLQVAEHWGQQTAIRPARRIGEWAMACVVLAIACIAVVVLRQPARPLPPEPVRAQQVFMRIPYVVPPAPYERTEIMHMDVPVAALIAAGFRLDTAMAAHSVQADVLVGQDGRPLAVSLPEYKND